MVLQGGPCGRVGHRRTSFSRNGHPKLGGHFAFTDTFPGEGSSCRTTTPMIAMSMEVVPTIVRAPDRDRPVRGVRRADSVATPVIRPRVLSSAMTTVRLALVETPTRGPLVATAMPAAVPVAMVTRVRVPAARMVGRRATALGSSAMEPIAPAVRGTVVRSAATPTARVVPVATAIRVRSVAEAPVKGVRVARATPVPIVRVRRVGTRVPTVPVVRAGTRVPTVPVVRAVTAVLLATVARPAIVAPVRVRRGASIAKTPARPVLPRISASAVRRSPRRSPLVIFRVPRAMNSRPSARTTRRMSRATW